MLVSARGHHGRVVTEGPAKEVLTRYIEAIIFQAVAENMASEQSARMVAMKAASDNAKAVIGELKLVYNKARQAAITKEISEIVGGAEALQCLFHRDCRKAEVNQALMDQVSK